MICKVMHKKHHTLLKTELCEEGKGRKKKTFIEKTWKCLLCFRQWRTRQYLREK